MSSSYSTCNVIERFLRGQFIFGDHRRHRLAHETHLADGQQRMILHRVPVIRIEVAEVFAGEHGDYARALPRRRRIDRHDSRVRVRAAQHFGPGHVHQRHVAGVDRRAGHLGHAIRARHRMIHHLKFACALHRFPSRACRSTHAATC